MYLEFSRFMVWYWVLFFIIDLDVHTDLEIYRSTAISLMEYVFSIVFLMGDRMSKYFLYGSYFQNVPKHI